MNMNMKMKIIINEIKFLLNNNIKINIYSPCQKVTEQEIFKRKQYEG
jgi:hypothetical protein